MAETSCCIAASCEAKAYGVKTGTRISDARIMCPGIIIVEAKPPEYIRIHHRIIEAVEDCIHVEAVLSIDEMWAWLPFNWREPAFVMELGRKIKNTVEREISPFVKVSIGAAPNKYLAKMASKMRKPDGLFILEGHQLPYVLHELKLRDFTGIGSQMEMRLHASGIHTTAELCRTKKQILRGVWGGVLGDRLWHLLRGDEIPDLISAQKSIGHSHVLPPNLRKPDDAWPVIAKLLHKASERLRADGRLTGSLTMQIAFLRGVAWGPELRFPETDSTLALMTSLNKLWQDRPEPRSPLLQLGVVLGKLCDRGNYTPELFQTAVADAMAAGDDGKQKRLDETLDKLRARYGRSVIYFGNVHNARDTAPMRISFTHIPDPGLEQ